MNFFRKFLPCVAYILLLHTTHTISLSSLLCCRGHLLSIIPAARVLMLLLMFKRIFALECVINTFNAKLMLVDNNKFIQCTILLHAYIHVIWGHTMKKSNGHWNLKLKFHQDYSDGFTFFLLLFCSCCCCFRI